LAAVPPAAFGVETLGYERPTALIMRGVYNCCVNAIDHGVLPSDIVVKEVMMRVEWCDVGEVAEWFRGLCHTDVGIRGDSKRTPQVSCNHPAYSRAIKIFLSFLKHS
jgi:hypothetical protein